MGGDRSTRSYDPEAARRWNRKYRLKQYGVTEGDFTRMLRAQRGRCAMCRAPFEDGQPIYIDHDRGCCPEEKRSCGKCVRGLLCLRCNTALGYIERYGELANGYRRRLYLKQWRQARRSNAS